MKRFANPKIFSKLKIFSNPKIERLVNPEIFEKLESSDITPNPNT